MEPLANMLCSRGPEWGILVHNAWHVVSLYVDDVLIYLREQTESLDQLYELLERFGDMAGLRINWNKSCLFPLDPPDPITGAVPQQGRLPWAMRTFRYLGTQIYHSNKDIL